MFRGWFRMNSHCDACRYQFDRGPGYFLGSIYVNYGLTSILVVIGYFSLFLTGVLPHERMLLTLGAICLFFPMWFFRYARSIWVGFDQFWDPVEDEESDNVDAGSAN